MHFRNANPEEQNAIFALYQSAIGDPFCTWNAFYPGMEEIEADLQAGCLYVLAEGERIAGALSVVPENEMDGFSCWNAQEGAREIARVVVAREYRGQGLSLRMLEEILARLQSQGCRTVHLAVAKINLPAQKSYARCGFQTVGEAEMYENSYFLMERTIQ